MNGQPSPVELHRLAVDGFGARVHAITDEQWGAPTPCTAWDVRDLVAHLVGEQLWVGALLRGETIAEVGDRFDGDQLGADPRAAWDRAAADALAAFAAPGALDRIVHLSYGDVPARGYCLEMACDATVHTWDLARAIGASERLEPTLVAAASELVEARFDEFTPSGLFGAPVPAPAGADAQAALLARLGRHP